MSRAAASSFSRSASSSSSAASLSRCVGAVQFLDLGRQARALAPELLGALGLRSRRRGPRARGLLLRGVLSCDRTQRNPLKETARSSRSLSVRLSWLTSMAGDASMRVPARALRPAAGARSRTAAAARPGTRCCRADRPARRSPRGSAAGSSRSMKLNAMASNCAAPLGRAQPNLEVPLADDARAAGCETRHRTMARETPAPRDRRRAAPARSAAPAPATPSSPSVSMTSGEPLA